MAVPPVNPRTVFLTGASGFVGGYICAALLDLGHKVKALYRRQTPPEDLLRARDRGAELVRGDLTDTGSRDAGSKLAKTMEGADVLIHAAGLVDDWGTEELFTRMNVEPVTTLLNLAQSLTVRQFIYISSVAVYGFGDHVDTTEEGPYYPLINPYQTSKKKAESVVLSGATPSLAVTVVRPGNVYGPGDTTVLYPIFEAMRKGIWIYVGGGESLTCPVYATDLADAVCSCIDNPAARDQVFNITGGEKTTWKELLTAAAGHLDIPIPRKRIPVFAARAAAVLMEGAFKLVKAKRSPMATRYRVEQVSHNYHFSIRKASSLLGYKPRVLWPEGMERTVRDFLKKDARNG